MAIKYFGPGEFAAHLEQRMAEHARFLHDLEAQWVNEIVDEVQALPKRKPRSGDLFTLLPDPLHHDPKGLLQ